jgi:hypothetical protein
MTAIGQDSVRRWSTGNDELRRALAAAMSNLEIADSSALARPPGVVAEQLAAFSVG